MSFINDIKGKNTQLYPIVTIEPSTDEGSFIDKFNECIFLSTNNINLEFVHIYDAENSPFPEGKKHYFKPLLLNIPSIKQSIDIERKKFKISNVSLEVSNYEYQGKRFNVRRVLKEDPNENIEYWKSLIDHDIVLRKDGFLWFLIEISNIFVANEKDVL